MKIRDKVIGSVRYALGYVITFIIALILFPVFSDLIRKVKSAKIDSIKIIEIRADDEKKYKEGSK